MAVSQVDGIICFSTDPWGEMKRPGQLMRRLSGHVPVVYVDAPLSCMSILKNWRHALAPSFRDRIGRALSRRSHEVEPGLHVVTPLTLIAPQRLSFALTDSALGAFSARQHARSVRKASRALAALGIARPVVWVSYPMSLPDDSVMRDSVIVYDCMDRWTGFPDSMGDLSLHGLVSALEDALLRRADVVLCSARGLYESKRQVAPGKTLLVRNGADVAHFAPACRSVPEDIARMSRPIVGYVGAVAEWVDFELLRDVARTRPGWSIVLVGPVFQGRTMGDSSGLRQVRDLPNVYLLGPRPYADVPSYVAAFDVATIPFRCNGLTEDTNPIKVYEYLAAGIPVVSTPMPEVLEVPGVHVAGDAAAFVDAVEQAMRVRDDAGLTDARVATARANSWEHRAEVAWSAILEAADGRVASR